MSLKLGNTPIAGISTHTNVNAHSLFDFKWSDHKLNEISWLEASTFSWQSGDVYVSAYNHLVQDLQGITPVTETVGSYTLTTYRATDGHKICLADQEQTILNIYNTYGIAWYYILDTANTQFKLPRTKFGFEGLRNNVGDMIAESLPQHTHNINKTSNRATFASWDNSGGRAIDGGTRADYTANTSVTDKANNSTYQDSAPVQERATQMYLYFYVGDYTQTAIEQTAGLNSEIINQKVDRSDLAKIYPVIETYINGSSWYRIYAKDENGYWCEQGGLCPTSGDTSRTNTLLKNYRDANYTIMITENSTTATANNIACGPAWILSKTNSTFTIFDDMWGSGCFWEAKGYLAVGEV